MRFFLANFLIILIVQPAFAGVFSFSSCKTLTASVTPGNQDDQESSEEMAQEVAADVDGKVDGRVDGTVQRVWDATVEFTRAKRGYAILIGAMVGSAAIETNLSSNLPKNFAFLSQLLSELSTLGVYVFGSPIWNPLTSKLQKFAFDVNRSPEILPENPPESLFDALAENQRLEAVWLKSQEIYSLNAQMSRNLVNQFISSTRQNFYEAYRAMHPADPNAFSNNAYAADQVAEAAIRMRSLFKDVPPDDPSVKIAIRTAFSNYINLPNFSDLVFKQIKIHDPDSKNDEVINYYDRLLEAWFFKQK